MSSIQSYIYVSHDARDYRPYDGFSGKKMRVIVLFNCTKKKCKNTRTKHSYSKAFLYIVNYVDRNTPTFCIDLLHINKQKST